MTHKRLPDIQARFDAWGLWVTRGGGAAGGAMHPLARLMEWKSGKRVSVSGDGGFTSFVPVDEIECGLTDEAIGSLPPDLRDAVRAWHTCKGGTLESVAKEMGVVKTTFWRRLVQADHRVAEWLMERSKRRKTYAL